MNASNVASELIAEVLKALADPEVREKLNAQGLTLRGSSAAELGTATRAQLDKYARLFKQAGGRMRRQADLRTVGHLPGCDDAKGRLY